MMPSESDRHAWLPLALWAAFLLALAILAGAGTWMLENLKATSLLNEFFSAVSVLFGISAALHIVLLAPAALLHYVVSKITGVNVR
jgi:hypothetical protein